MGRLGLVLVGPHSPPPNPGYLWSHKEAPPPVIWASYFTQLLCLLSLSPVSTREAAPGRHPALPSSCRSRGCPRGRDTNHRSHPMERWQGQAGSRQQALWHLAIPVTYSLFPPAAASQQLSKVCGFEEQSIFLGLSVLNTSKWVSEQ